jgi:hypothetical protein
MEARKLQALEMVVETFDALVSERGDTGKIWASLLKDTLKRRRPDFSETYYGFRTFGNLLEEAQTRGLFEFGRDEKSGTYVFRSAQAIEALGGVAEAEPLQAALAPAVPEADDELAAETAGEQPSEIPRSGETAAAAAREPRRRGGRGRKGREQSGEQGAEQGAAVDAQTATDDAGMASWPAPTPDLVEADVAAATPAAVQPVSAEALEAAPGAAEQPAAPVKERRRAARKPAAKKGTAARAATEAGADDAAIGIDADGGSSAITDADPSDPAPGAAQTDAESDAQGEKADRKKSARPAHKAPSRKPATRARRPAKPKTPEGG